MQPCDTVAKGPLPCVKVLKNVNFPTLNFILWVCTNEDVDESLATVTEGVVHVVYNLRTQSSFGVTRQHKVS